jgi:hypothetical protein
MSIVIALIIVLVVGGLVVNFYPHPKKTEVIEGQSTWDFDNHIIDSTPEATPEPTIVAAINEQMITIEKSKKKTSKKPVSKNTAKVKPLAKMETKNKKSTKK